MTEPTETPAPEPTTDEAVESVDVGDEAVERRRDEADAEETGTAPDVGDDNA